MSSGSTECEFAQGCDEVNSDAHVLFANDATRLRYHELWRGNARTLESSTTSGEVRVAFAYDAEGVDDEPESELVLEELVLDELVDSELLDDEVLVELEELEDPRASFL